MKFFKHPSPLGSVFLVLGAILAAGPVLAQGASKGGAVQVGTSYQNDTSLPLYYLPPYNGKKAAEHEAAENPRIPNKHEDAADTVVQRSMFAPSLQMPTPDQTFDGIGQTAGCGGCAPPDTDGAVGDTQYVQMVNTAYQIFNKTTGASVAGPTQISALWAGFGGFCETGGAGDPIVLYDKLAKRWVISQFAGTSTAITDECIAVSTTSDAAGSYHRYGFHLGSQFFDYPHLGAWPDGYYMAMNVFDATSSAYLGPQPFAFDRAAMLAGTAATFVTTGIISANDAPILPADFDGQTKPAMGAPEPFVEFPGDTVAAYKVFHFHADFTTPANTTFTLAGSPAAAAFTAACTGSRACVPQVGVGAGDYLDGIGDRLMFRLAYRNFGGHEALVGNYTVSAGGVAAPRWFELRNATTGTPSVFQEGTYQPDATWRWMGSAAMDTMGNIAVGFSASSAGIHPQIRYAGRLAADPPGVLTRGEAHLFDGSASQTANGNRWGDYSDMSVDPVDDCTFWYTNEYVDANGWNTRIGHFKFSGCSLTPGFALSPTPEATSVCAGTSATFTINAVSAAGYQGAVTLSGSGNPAPSTLTLTPPIVATLPGSSSMNIGTSGVATGVYPITVHGTSTGASAQSVIANLSVFATAPGAPALTAPANAATNQTTSPTFTWTGSNTESYTIQVATDPAFTNIVFTQTLTGTSIASNVVLAYSTKFYWRVTPSNACGAGAASPTYTFTTATAPGSCSAGSTPQSVYSYGFESGIGGWTLGAGGIGTNTWADNTASFHSGAHSWYVADVPTTSDQRFISPPIVLPSGQLPLTLQFWNKRNIEQESATACWDGGILEVSTNAGSTWTQVNSAAMLADPYTGLISSLDTNPLKNLQGWCGTQDWTHTVVDLGAYAGQTAQFRFRLGTDSSNGGTVDGWYLDDVSVQSCSAATVQHTVTPVAGANGSIAPSTPVQVNNGSTTSFTLNPNVGYVIGSVTGCGGSLAGNVYTTAPVTADCTVNAAFNAVQPGDIAISISDARSYAQYGAALTYAVILSNPTSSAVSGIGIGSVFPAQLNVNQANWKCLGGPGVTCTASGTGALSDSGVAVPANGSVTWLVTAPVLPNASGGNVLFTVTATSAGDPNTANNTASDDDVLVLFRSGFDPGNDGGNRPQH